LVSSPARRSADMQMKCAPSCSTEWTGVSSLTKILEPINRPRARPSTNRDDFLGRHQDNGEAVSINIDFQRQTVDGIDQEH